MLPATPQSRHITSMVFLVARSNIAPDLAWPACKTAIP